MWSTIRFHILYAFVMKILRHRGVTRCAAYTNYDRVSMLQVIPLLEVTTQSLNILKNTLYTVASYKMLDPFHQFSLFSKKFQGT